MTVMTLLRFMSDAVREMFRGPQRYWGWLGLLAVIVAIGATQYASQLQDGLVVTGMSDQVSWGFYIANFAFLVGIAAAAVLLVIPAYLFDRKDVKEVVLIGEGMAVAAVVMAMAFVTVDLGRPDRLWHLLPGIGEFNWPLSLLAWDIVVLTEMPETVVHAVHDTARRENSSTNLNENVAFPITRG